MTEAFELFNVVCSLTPRGRRDKNMVEQTGPYYERVQQHFQPYAGHRLVRRVGRRLDGRLGSLWYVVGRGNSYAYHFAKSRGEGGKIRRVTGPERVPVIPVFNPLRHHRRQWEDFARQSNFRQFYSAQRPTYRADSVAVARQLNLRQMQRWLEQQFPARFARYRVVFSPLIGGTHSTSSFGPAGQRQATMFIPGAPPTAGRDSTLQEALYTGIVFTEIDHNYVNPISDRHKSAVKAAFGNLGYWTAGLDSRNYQSPSRTFNEYMTHAVFLVYVREHYAPATYEKVRKSRVRLNVERRGFVRFADFADELLRCYQQRKPGETLTDLYPQMLAWSQTKAMAVPQP